MSYREETGFLAHAVIAFLFCLPCHAKGAPATWLQKESSGIFSNTNAEGIVKGILPAFDYGGKAFDIAAWKCSRREAGVSNHATVAFCEFLSPDRKLRFTLETRVYQDYPVTELRPVLETVGNVPTEIIENFHSFVLKAQPDVHCVTVRAVTGSDTKFTDFIRRDTVLLPRSGCDSLMLTTAEGRSSSTWLPYFGVDFEKNEGVEVAIGWTGNWQANFNYTAGTRRTPDVFTLSAGFKDAHFRMLPGEHFFLPSILLYLRHSQSRRDGSVMFHRFLIAHKTPRDGDGKICRPLLSIGGSFGSRPDKELIQIAEIRKLFPSIAFDNYWIDADWYTVASNATTQVFGSPLWYENSGDWLVNKKYHPDGTLRSVSDAVHALGLKFLLWFEAERATDKTSIVHDHPEYFLRRHDFLYSLQCLVNLGDPAAWNYLVNRISGLIQTNGVDVYRQDFNMDPNRNWQEHDTADRAGVTEIKYINGLWAFWKTLRERFPGILLENCASGGRRMDFEMMSLSHSYCRDDANLNRNPEELFQNATLNSTAYIPFTGGDVGAIKKLDDYGMMSCLAASMIFRPTAFLPLHEWAAAKKEDLAWFERMLTIFDRVRPYFFGDFYALTETVAESSEIWCAYQLNDPRSQSGFFIAYRRAKCAERSLRLTLGGIEADTSYELEIVAPKVSRQIVSGAELASYLVTLDKPRSYYLAFYKQVSK